MKYKNFHCEINNLKLTEFAFKEIIDKLNTNNATGPDLIHNILLTAANGVISPNTFLQPLFKRKRLSIWKTATVTVHTKDDAILCNSYRPISLLSCVAKAFDRCVHKHIWGCCLFCFVFVFVCLFVFNAEYYNYSIPVWFWRVN